MILRLKLQGLYNAMRSGSPSGYIFVSLIAALVVYGEWIGVQKALSFLEEFGVVGTSVAKRTLETAFIVLSAGVMFSAVTTAISTLYLSDDLNFLLSQPISASLVFGSKLVETFISASGTAFLLTLPLVLSMGVYFHAPWWFYWLSVWLCIMVYALPVGLGAGISVLLMRFAPAGRVKEVATGLGVVLSAGLVYFVRALRPEQLLNFKDPFQFDALLKQFAGSEDTLMPPALASRALWDAAQGNWSTSVYGITVIGIVVLWLAGALAALAYREGWVRGLEGTHRALNPRKLVASWGERTMAKFGAMGHVFYKDLRLQLRDATQWSQLLVLVALVGVYLVSLSAFPLAGAMGTPRFRNVIGFLQMAFQGFIVAGVGMRMAFPALSLEGYGFWLLQTAPVSYRNIVWGKYIGALLPVLLVSVMMAWQSSVVLKLNETVSMAMVLVGVGSALGITALGVGLGAMYPRFKADNPAEIGMSPGGLMYMLLSLGYTGLLVMVMARPVYQSLTEYVPNYWQSLEGIFIFVLWLVVALLVTIVPLYLAQKSLERSL